MIWSVFRMTDKDYIGIIKIFHGVFPWLNKTEKTCQSKPPDKERLIFETFKGKGWKSFWNKRKKQPFTKFGQVKTNVNKFGAIWQFWYHLDKFELIWTYLEEFSPFLTSLSILRNVWTNLIKFGHIWSNLDKFRRVWINLDNNFSYTFQMNVKGP